MGSTRYSFVPGKGDQATGDEDGFKDEAPTDARLTPIVPDPFAGATTLRPGTDSATGSWNDLLAEVGKGHVDASTLCHRYGFGIGQLGAIVALTPKVRKGDEAALATLKRLWDERER